MICCGEERSTNYCPECGRAIPKVGIAELVSYIKKRMQQEAKRLEECKAKLSEMDLIKLPTDDGVRKAVEETKADIERIIKTWSDRLQSVEDLIAAAKEVEAKAARKSKAKPEPEAVEAGSM